MNENHLTFLASPAWAEQLSREVLPWIASAGELGDDVIEIGPGPGLSTDLLRERVAHVTAVEVDEQLASALKERLAGTNVDVLCGDGAATGLPADRFSAATAFLCSTTFRPPSIRTESSPRCAACCARAGCSSVSTRGIST